MPLKPRRSHPHGPGWYLLGGAIGLFLVVVVVVVLLLVDLT